MKGRRSKYILIFVVGNGMESILLISMPGNSKRTNRVMRVDFLRKRTLYSRMSDKAWTIFRIYLRMIYPFNPHCITSHVRIGLVVLGLVLWSSCCMAQKIIGISTQYDDRFDKWLIVTDTSDLEGTIEATWAALGDFTEWQYNIGEQSGIIRIRQKTNPDVWELMGGGEIIEARTIFPRERDRWQMQNGKHRVDV